MENSAIVVVESLAHGVLVIASKGTPWSELETEHGGLGVDNDRQALVAAIEKIRSIPLQDMVQRGREWMKEQYSWESISGEMLLRLYRACVERHVN